MLYFFQASLPHYQDKIVHTHVCGLYFLAASCYCNVFSDNQKEHDDFEQSMAKNAIL